jgi:heat shock protein HslJ
MRHAKVGAAALLIGLALATFGAACDDDDDAGAALAGTSWVLVSLAGDDLLSGTEATAEFTDDQVSGSTGCNSYSGAYEADDGSDIDFDEQFAVTERACERAIMDQEAAFLAALAAADSFSLAGDDLTIESGAGALMFERARS